MNVVDEDRARQKLAEKVENEDKDIVDIEPSDSYSVATKLRDQFRDFLNRS